MEKIVRMQSLNSFDVKEDPMKRIAVPILGIFAILIAGLFLSFVAVADDNICILQADVDKVHVTVWDEDSG
jgi:hypothetical protein